MSYRCVTTSVDGFIQQLAVSCIGQGYYFYTTGRIPPHKLPAEVDAKLISRYGIDISKWSRVRRKRGGLANMQYLRHDRFFILLCTHGAHRFFEDEAFGLRDARHTPVRYGGYSVSFRNGHPHVRIDQDTYNLVKANYLEIATHPAQAIERSLSVLPFEAYAPVRRQLLNLLRATNQIRRVAGLDDIHHSCLNLRRRIVKPFG